MKFIAFKLIPTFVLITKNEVFITSYNNCEISADLVIRETFKHQSRRVVDLYCRGKLEQC